MTEKRFYTDGQYLMQKGEVWVVAGGEHSADVIATALNELIEERNKLQFDYNMEVLTRQSIEKENEQLKQTIKTIKEICNQHKIPNLLTTYIPVNCEKRKGCLNNHMTNANNMGKSNLAKEILELI